MIDLNPPLSKRNEDVNEVDDSFEHTLTHIYQGEMKM